MAIYLEIIAIFCIAIVPFSLCNDDVQTLMTEHEVEMVFQRSKLSVPRHEFITIENFPQPSYSPVNGKRIVPSDGHMWIRTFASDINLWLHPSDSSLIEEDTPVYHAKYSSDKPGEVEFVKQNDAMKRIGQLYVDKTHWASLVIGVDASGKTRVNGHIASRGITIRSLPDHVVKEYLRTRRSINESEYLSSNLSYHVAFNTYENFEIPKSAYAFNKTSLRERIRRSATTTDEIPYQLVLELAVVVENSLYKVLKTETYCLEYLLAFWNAVDLRFRNLENPQLRLHISAIIIGMEPRSTPYISRHQKNGYLEAIKAMEDAQTFFYKIKDSISLDSYDVAVTMTSQSLDRTVDGDIVAGRAYGGDACTRYSDSMKSLALVRDNGGFSGILVAAHELGHTLAMPHDDGKNVPCKSRDGYIMGESVTSSLNSWSFSSCSLQDFELILHWGRQFKCLYNQPKIETYSLPRIMPGRMKTLDEQCRDEGALLSCSTADSDWCDSLSCIMKDRRCMRLPSIRALEGTPCGSLDNMYCLRGRCTQIPEPSAEKLRQMLAASNWIDREKNINTNLRTN